MARFGVAHAILNTVEKHGFDDGVVERVNAALGKSAEFATRRELALAVAEAIINELMDLVGTTALADLTHPLERIAGGVRASLLVMREYPGAAGFLGRMGYPAFRPGIFGFSIVERDVERAAEMDLVPRFRIRSALDFVVGPVFSAMAQIPSAPLSDDEIADLAYRVLLAIGAGEEQARNCTSRPIATPVPAADGVLRRSQLLEQIAR